MIVEVLEEERGADHFIYITDNSKFCTRYPNWKITRTLGQMIQEIIDGQISSKASENIYSHHMQV